MPLRQFSLSAYQTWQRCEQRYYYQYIRKLRPLVKEIAPQRGIMLHEYLAAYYGGLKAQEGPEVSHQLGLAKIATYEPTVRSAVTTLFMAGQEDKAKEYEALLPEVVRIAERYHIVRGQWDAARYHVETVEETLRYDIVYGIESVSVVDVVTIDRDGRRALWEHKTAGTIPSSKNRIRDLQTLLYATALRVIQNRQVDYVNWNYLRTKPPTIPKLLANGHSLSRDARLDTTWAAYQEAIKQHELNEALYQDVRDRLEGKEEEDFFPRFEQAIVAVPQVLLRDYATEAVRARTATIQWERNATAPVRTIGFDCNMCPFLRVCEAAIVGGDEEDVIRINFRVAGKSEEAA